MRKFFFTVIGLSIVFFVFSCNNQADNNVSNTDSVSADQIEVIPDDVVVENFDEFYQKFLSDNSFQLERVQFPLRGSKIVDIGEEEQWTKDDWQYLEGDINEVDKSIFDVEIIVEDNKVTHKVSVPNSGFQMREIYELIDNKWYLTELFESDL